MNRSFIENFDIGKSEIGESSLPLTAAQREIWFAQLVNCDVRGAYNISEYLEINGPVELLRLARDQDLRLHKEDGRCNQCLGEITVDVPILHFVGNGRCSAY